MTNQIETAKANPAAFKAMRDALGVAPRLLHVGTRTGLFGASASNGTNLQLNSRTNHYIPVACRNLRFGWSNIWVNSGTNPYETPGTVDVTKLTVGVSNVTTGETARRVFFGAPETTLPIEVLKISDPQGGHIAAGNQLQLLVHAEVSSSTPFYRGRATVAATGERSEEGATVTDRSLSGGIATAGAFSYGPQLILGVPDNGAVRSVALIGDSITEGGSGGETANGSTGVIGYPEKGIGVLVPSAKFTRSGDKLRAWAFRRYSRMAMILQYFTDAFVNLGANDLYQEHRSLAQMQADATGLVQELQASGLAVTMPTLMPITAGSSGYTAPDGSDQTVTNAGDEVTRVAYNAWLMAGGLPGVRVIDVASAVSMPSDRSKWIAGYTGDGLHPNNTGAAAAAALHTPALYGY